MEYKCKSFFALLTMVRCNTDRVLVILNGRRWQAVECPALLRQRFGFGPAPGRKVRAGRLVYFRALDVGVGQACLV